MTAIAANERATLPVQLQKCLEALDQKKADEIRVLYVGDVSSVTDYFLIATGTSNPHLKALAGEVIDVLKAFGEESSVSGLGDNSGWVVVDAYDFMVHLFTEEMRAYYSLETLWKDGNLIEW